MNLEQLLESPVTARLLRAQRTDMHWHRLAMACTRLLSENQIWRLFQLSVSGLDVALCLHHISRRYRDELTMPADELDAFLSRAAQVEHPGGSRWLTVTFDDGYLDAWHYVMTRARRFPNQEWLVFVCPTKAERQAAFRWDLEGGDDDVSPRDSGIENHRTDLKAASHLSDAHLATVEQCRSLRAFDNVHLGNHTNCHFRTSALPLAHALDELQQSRADFERLFGPERHFAFPFGRHGVDFDDRHVESIRRATDAIIWTTVPQPFLHAQRRPGAVLPRFGVDGRWSASQLAFLIAVRSLRARVQGLAAACSDSPALQEGDTAPSHPSHGDPARAPRPSSGADALIASIAASLARSRLTSSLARSAPPDAAEAPVAAGARSEAGQGDVARAPRAH
jgi:peptidoglycan/xylan/chitin deacetylase (PgdA/CDA1 family)